MTYDYHSCTYCSSGSLAHYPTFFFFNDTATTEIYTLSLHDALPISFDVNVSPGDHTSNKRPIFDFLTTDAMSGIDQDRKSTRLNSSHQIISYAVFCLKKKK